MLDAAVLTTAAMPRRAAEAQDRATQLDVVFARYLDPVYRFLYSRVGNREDAEDLTSEVFLKASKQLDHTRPEASMAKWLFTVAQTVLADHWRQYYRSGAPLPLDETRAAEIPETSRSLEPGERTTELLATVLDRLPPRYRLVLELRFLQGYSLLEAAREMNVTVDNVKVIQHRALARAVKVAGDVL